MNIIEKIIQDGVAQNNFQAAHIANGLRLYELEDESYKVLRCKLYRKWRSKTDKKNEIPSWQAFQLAIAGIDPDDIEPRQIDMFDMSEPAEPEADDSARFHGHQEGTAV